MPVGVHLRVRLGVDSIKFVRKFWRLITPTVGLICCSRGTIGARTCLACMSDAPYDRKTGDLMARVLDDALAAASLKVLGLSEDDWSEMADAISHAVAGGLRDTERLQRIALDALDARREKLCREVFASSMVFASGADIVGLHAAGAPTTERRRHSRNGHF
jgi:hypothetical protein